MWVWLVGSYTAFLILLSSCAGYVTLFLPGKERREHAYKVLKLALGTGTGGTGALGAVQLAQQLGLF
jgi:hypothetical protein